MNLDLFFETHAELPRQGPGNTASTLRALELLPDLPARPRILDVGCGPGTQTLDLLRATSGSVVAVDTHRPFLDELERRADAAGLGDRLELLSEDMGQLGLPAASFDLVWGEGSLYSIGFANALAALRPLLRPGGLLAASELTWLRADAPEAPKEFFDQAYPAMTTIDANCDTTVGLGYEPLDHFVLPNAAWWDDYYTPLGVRLEALEQKYAQDETALAQLRESRNEIELFAEHGDAYGYVFYVMRRTDVALRHA